MSINQIVHQGKVIIFADYRECKKADQQLALLEEVSELIREKSDVRLLVDYEGVSGGVEYMVRVKDLGNTVFKEHLKCSATLGITGVKKIFFRGYNMATGAKNVKAFGSRDEALDWLVNFE